MHERFMRRALDLATLGRGLVSPNPMVGCVIVHESEGGTRIIGEGWHQRYGDWHAEVNAVRSVQPEDAYLLPESTVYVTLEPCSHWGKTPPCANLLIDKQVKQVVCCNDDPNPLVSGQGFDRLRAAGVTVETGVLNELGRQLNARFFTFFEQQRPYLILKWAETADGFISGPAGQSIAISGPLAQRLVHRWRSEEDGIMVGTTTARIDNPRLNVRHWPGRNPTRIVIDKLLQLPASLHLFDNTQPTLVYNFQKTEISDQITYQQLRSEKPFLSQLLADLHARRIQSVFVEGGSLLLTSLLDAGFWDELRVFRSPKLVGDGVKAPTVRGTIQSREQIGDDELTIYRNNIRQ
ncbi:bifunctional diaminohydroxyphosphoribosylaminopyrimidine deaminase/5-amino-6-(5-phosphoribosylamino)uracil reductase RibD [Spirosoma sp. KUDC1026]|uniref:bifunctional diaminohydroxyphosphoribosylaminopyrimidine deaminase/5-amino-6-(5-phosphoribosylamino)uracil reductase RibD n=1 Tax=Spirosoma sp. KUDC1026 TaxID=2745947 RepID=UPI00159BC553|nr:bifunctional diaminohydroxyphosphoribosylaminopyrimidine deaminase/5-amino-6-(5-phosphoribosylamino)uracil reductase RibD [Spirosoma sp. KUDC1026]QKZ12592.1 bifunctional diaminohydroxyphosphoribosylaminopyrimidine deaminase/5-amino-6-(5-phosphoribosylamino)uracil reductase RibD [Spirosoma sp. KUDC1026]